MELKTVHNLTGTIIPHPNRQVNEDHVDQC